MRSVLVGNPDRQTSFQSNKRVFVTSPLNGDVEGNMRRADEYCKQVLDNGDYPYASHVYLPRYLDDNDPKQRGRAIQAGLAFLKVCHALCIFGTDKPTEGMQKAIEFARVNKIPIITPDQLKDIDKIVATNNRRKKLDKLI